MTYILRIHRVSFLNRLVPFYFCISFYVTGSGIRTLVSMACLYIVSIKLDQPVVAAASVFQCLLSAAWRCSAPTSLPSSPW